MIHIGTCSWTDPSLITSDRFYPRRTMTAEERLKFYASRFDTVEVDSTFYALPSERMVALQTERTPPHFTLHYKVFGLLTQHMIDPKKLPIPVRNLLEPDVVRKSRLRYSEVPEDAKKLAGEMFRSALVPAASGGKLGIILFQFPPYFTFSRENLDFIAQTNSEFEGYRLAIEFRHSSWVTGENRKETFKFLREHKLAYVSVDEPQFESGVTPPPIAEATSDISYVRFHGRNSENWFKKGISAAERFSYDYSDDELRSWIPKIKALSRASRATYAMFNNCHFHYAVENALRLSELVKD